MQQKICFWPSAESRPRSRKCACTVEVPKTCRDRFEAVDGVGTDGGVTWTEPESRLQCDSLGY